MNNDRTLNIKLPDKLYQELKQSAERKNISLASLVRMVCSEWIEQNSVNGLTESEVFERLPGRVVD